MESVKAPDARSVAKHAPPALQAFHGRVHRQTRTIADGVENKLGCLQRFGEIVADLGQI